MRASLLSAVCGLFLLVGCEKLDYHRLELPGFSIEVPKQLTFSGDQKAQYRTGKVESRIGLKFVSVSWQVGAIATTEELPGIAQAMAKAMPDGMNLTFTPARSETINGQKATWLDAKIESVKFVFVDIECGRRSVLIGLGAASGFDDMRKRITSSFKCAPVEADEKALASAVPIGITDAAALDGWFAIPNDDAFTISDGQMLAVFTEVPQSAIDGKTLEKVLPSLFAAYGGQWAPSRRAQRGGREMHYGTMTMDGATMPTVLSLWSCGGRGDMVMGMVMRIEGEDLDAAADFLAKTRCSQPGDPPLPLEPTPPEYASDPGTDGE